MNVHKLDYIVTQKTVGNLMSTAPHCHLLVAIVEAVYIVLLDRFDACFVHTFTFQHVLYSLFIYSIFFAKDRTGKTGFRFKIFTSEKGL